MDDEDVIHIRFNIKRKTASALWDEISIAERLCDFFRQPGRLRYVPPAARRQMEQELKPLMNGRWALGVGRWALFAAFPAFVAIKIYAEAYWFFAKFYDGATDSQAHRSIRGD